MTADRLKFWNGSGEQVGHKEWECAMVAAYSLRDAIALVKEQKDRPGVHNELANYFGHTDEPPPAARQAAHGNVARGVLLYDRDGASVMFLPPKVRSVVDDVPAEAQAAAAAAPAPIDYGKLRTGFSRGVQVDVWKYESPHGDRAHADLLTAIVRLQPKNRRESGGENGMEFVASCDIFEDNLRSTNIETLFAKVQEAFKTYDLAQRGIVWEDWLEITVRPDRGHRDERTSGLNLGYEVIKRGVDPRSGKAYTFAKHSGGVIPFPKAKAAGQRGTHEDDFYTGGDEQIAYLPAKPETVAALDHIIDRLNELGARLQVLLAQDVVAKELGTIAGRLLEFKS